jgi:mycofactocin precursor
MVHELAFPEGAEMADNPAVLTGPVLTATGLTATGLTGSASDIMPGRAAEVPADDAPDAAVLVQDLLVEEVSIDGMCGVY